MELRDKNLDTIAINELAERYVYPKDDKPIIDIGGDAQDRGYYTYEDFLTVCKWKTDRSQTKCTKNDDDEVEEITRIALSAKCERARITSLLGLHGVNYPTASALLHFGHKDKYPIIDWRALETYNIPRGTHYTFDLWVKYLEACRRDANEYQVCMRIFDKAIWQYSKENPIMNKS